MKTLPYKYSIRWIFILFTFFKIQAQQNIEQKQVDSLLHRLKTEKTDAAQVDIYKKLIKFYKKEQSDSALYYATSMADKARKMVWHEAMYISQKEILDIKINNENFNTAMQKSIDRFNRSIKESDTIMILNLARAIGDHYHRRRFYKECIAYNLKVLEIAENIPKSDVDDIYVDLLSSYSMLGNYDASLEYAFKALAIYENDPSKKRELCNTYNNIAQIYLFFDTKEGRILSLKYSDKSLKISKENDFFFNITNALNNKALAFSGLKKTKEAEQNALEAIALSKTHHYTYALRRSYSILADLYFKVKDYDQSIVFYEQLLDLSNTGNDMYGKSISSLGIGRTYSRQRKFKKAREYLNRGKSLSIQLGTTNEIRLSYEYLYKLDSAENKFNNAFENIKIFYQYRDSIFSKQKDKNIKELEIKYQTKIKDQEIELLTKENILQSALTKQEKRQKQYFLIGGIGLLLMSGFMYNRYRVNKRNLTIIKSQKDAIEEKNNENELLIKEIHHRVKNNLQIILSLLNSQLNALPEKNVDAENIILDSKNRIESISLIHQNLYQSNNFIEVETQLYFEDLLNNIIESHSDVFTDILVEKKIDNCVIKIPLAVPLGLIINEIIVNAFKHAFDNTIKPEIKFAFNKDNDMYNIMVQDNGKGWSGEVENKKSFGMQLIKGLLNQLHGKLDVQGSNGTSFFMKIPFEVH